MSVYRAKLAYGRDALAAWLQEYAVPSLFASVTFEGGVIECYDEDDNLLLKINASGYIYAYRADGNSINFTSDYNVVGANDIDIIACDNGFILENPYYVGQTGTIAMLVTKTNNGKVAIIFSGISSSHVSMYYNNIKHVAWGDSETMATTTSYTPESGQQTVLVPFSTNANTGDISYTPNAFYMSMCQNYNIGISKFFLGLDTYITNGYWAIKDERS